jgi:menaquinone-specific isochorismate synthase
MPPYIFDIYNDSINTDELTESLFVLEELTDRINEVCQLSAKTFKSSLFTITIPFESIDPLAALEFLSTENDFQFYWEHPDEKLSIAAGKEIVRIRTNQRDRFNIVQKQISDWQQRTISFSSLTHSLSGLHFLGGFSFQDQPQEHHWRSFGTASLIIPEWLLIRDGQLSLLTVTSKVQPNSHPEELKADIRNSINDIIDSIRNLTKTEQKLSDSIPARNFAGFEIIEHDDVEKKWKLIVSNAKSRINNGEFKKIVLAREVGITYKSEPCATQMLNYLRNEYPTCYTFMVKMHRNATFLGCTPEKLVAIRSTFILTDGLAGTISRGKTATEDAILERRLMQSDKDLVEHGFVVDAIGSRLRDITHNINFPVQPGIRKYQNVQHLYTPITANLNKNVSPLQIIEKLHPTPAVGGYPRESTVQHIQSLENIDRGWYAGPVGWINTHGRGEFCVAIRSGLLQQGHARFFAGCGIVADSDPQSEWNETNLKLIPMLSALNNA